jgi:(1->4)-alpha-D-glucan 1-alpha-D-glucosylmutase
VVERPQHTPRSTYRLQVHPDLAFGGVAALAPYLAELGVSHIYLSPCLQAMPGSSHGYDAVDPTRFDDSLGGDGEFGKMVSEVTSHGLGLVLDIVPNHLAASASHNPFFRDVLEKGPDSPHARVFDIDWSPDDPRLTGKVLLPILGDHYGKVRGEGHIRLALQGEDVVVRVYDRALPLRRGSLEALRGVGEPLEALVARINASSEDLDRLLDQQHYRLAWWRTARHDLNYRRFFDIHDLIGVRVEHPEVFDLMHAHVLEQVHQGHVHGLRVDHPDGLHDPAGYFQRLRERAPEAWVVAEKILAMDEELPDDWPVEGTTGYEFLNRLTGLFVDPRGEEAITDAYVRFTGEEASFHEVARRCKASVLRDLFGSELQRVARRVCAVCGRHPDHRDHTLPDVRKALFELVVAMPVYRTYVHDGTLAREADVARLNQAARDVRQRAPGVDERLLKFLVDLFSGRIRGELEDRARGTFQQLTGPVMAKGVEDTALYRHHRLVCLNEVGGEPDQFGTTPEDFHAFCERVQARWPATLLATSTHDTKRSEDVRSRIALLSEIPHPWAQAVARWSRLAARHRQDGWPDRPIEYLVYQTLVGAWPITRDRLVPYVIKAAREAKVHTSWHHVDAAYEGALQAFVEGVLQEDALVTDLENFLAPLVPAARWTSLSQLLLKLTAPGVPDIHQGMELWRHDLVDPDNRRPVDFEARRRLLRRLAEEPSTPSLARDEEGVTKLFVTMRALQVRARWPQWFGRRATYAPLPCAGADASRLVAFIRSGSAVTVAPRLLMRFEGDWADTEVTLPPGPWHHAMADVRLEGGPVRAGELFDAFPVALLTKEAQ